MEKGIPGRFVAALGFGGKVRVMVVVADGPAEELRARHDLMRNAGMFAAEALVASVLMAAHIKGEERLTVNVESEAPEFSFVADVDSDGSIRGRLRPNRLVPGRTFTGVISVMKSLGRKELYRGVADVTGERIEGALQRYLTASQQVDARVRVDATHDTHYRIVSAGGLLVERLPHMDPDEFQALVLPALQGDLRDILTEFAFGSLGGQPVEVLGSRELVFRCSCSRERVVAMIKALGADEIRGMIEDQGKAEVTCHYCSETYALAGAELEALLVELQGN